MLELPRYILNSLNNNKTSLGEHPAYPPEEEEKFIINAVANKFSDIVKNIMENTYKLDVPLKVDIEYGCDWYQAK